MFPPTTAPSLAIVGGVAIVALNGVSRGGDAIIGITGQWEGAEIVGVLGGGGMRGITAVGDSSCFAHRRKISSSSWAFGDFCAISRMRIPPYLHAC